MSGHGDPWAAQTGLTAILIAVPELAEFTDRWRSASYSTAWPTLPLTELVPPHVTVLVPWVRDPTAGGRAATRGRRRDPCEPFELSFPTAGQFPNGTAWLRPEPFDEVRDLLKTVIAAFPECPPYGGEFPDPQPHLTIASSTQGGPAVVAEAQAALAAEPAPVVQLTELGLWREDKNGVWRQFDAVPLGA